VGGYCSARSCRGVSSRKEFGSGSALAKILRTQEKIRKGPEMERGENSCNDLKKCDGRAKTEIKNIIWGGNRGGVTITGNPTIDDQDSK